MTSKIYNIKINNSRIALPFVETNRTLRGLGFKIRYDAIKSHCCGIFDWMLEKLLVYES